VSERRNITQPTDWWAAFEQQATADGWSNLSAWVGDCCRANLDKQRQQGLSERPTVGAPKRPSPKSN